MRFFNTTGPCRADQHYMLPAASRLGAMRLYIERRQYVVLHAARQSGKTTALEELARQLLDEGRYASAVLSCEVASPFADVERAEPAILQSWRQTGDLTLPPDLRPPPWPEAPVGTRVGAALGAWAQSCPRPLVLFLDEVAALRDEALLSLLRQLRASFGARPGGFPHSIVLVGLRDVRDYAMAAGSRLGTASPFNVKVESLTLTDFSRAEVGALLAQHTAETGQAFEDEAVDEVYAQARGQPWLTNALGATLVDVVAPDRRAPITREAVAQAVDLLIRRRDTHLDSLAVRLVEPRVRAVLEPLLAGSAPEATTEDDRQFVIDLGLLRRMPTGDLDFANPIYRNVIGRVLASGPFDAMPRLEPVWLDERGNLVPERLLSAFLAFWSRHGAPLLQAAAYPEIAPHLVLMAFLDRVANGGGTIDREFAAGAGRVDLVLRYRGATVALELKVWRSRRPDPLPSGLRQLDEYLDRLGLPTGWLVIFDQHQRRRRRAGGPRVEAAESPAGRAITVVRA